MAINGSNLRLFIKGEGDTAAKCIGAAQSCTFHIGTSVETITTKDSGEWDESEVTGKSWDASTDALVLTSDTGAKTAVDIISLIGKTVTLTFDVTSASSDKNRTATNSTLKKTGTAIISDLSISASAKQTATYSITLTGVGALS